MLAATKIISLYDDFYSVQPCVKLASVWHNDNDILLRLYPACGAYVSGLDPNTVVSVRADSYGNPAEFAASINMTFGMAGWVALALHALGVEIYLRLTPRESDRLRNVSYQRQLKAGYKNPGNGGITAQRIGDANDFVPQRPFNLRETSDTTLVGSSDMSQVETGERSIVETA